MTSDDALEQGTFTWLVGIEDTCVYPAPDAGVVLDEFELTGHRTAWRDDLATARRLGARAVRYGVSWPLVHVAPGEYDWSILDDVLAYAVGDLGLEIVADLVHYGTPTWLEGSFADPRYPETIAEFAAAFASRYRRQVRYFTPLNEPITTASFCGLRGVWPPSLHGWHGWVTVAVPIAVGMVRATTAIREANAAAKIVHVEASMLISTDEAELEDHAAHLGMIGWLPTDLMMGRVEPDDEAWTWLVKHGASTYDLAWLNANGVRPDYMGVNYYPDLTPRALQTVNGEVLQVSHNAWAAGLRTVLTAFAERYHLPIIITETSIEGSDEVRTDWLTDSMAAIDDLIADGVDIRGYTWWPLMDFVDWSWASGGENVEEFAVATVDGDGELLVGPTPPLGRPTDGKNPFLRRMGLVRLQEEGDGELVRIETDAAIEFSRLAKGPT